MCDKNCMSCLNAAARIDKRGNKGWGCKLNGFAVNARMMCEEWTQRMRRTPLTD